MNYRIRTILSKSETLVVFSGNSDRIVKYFVLGNGDGKFLQFSKLVATTQNDLQDSDLEVCDYLQAVIGIPIFSKRFVDTMASALGEEVMFFPIEIQAKKKILTFFLTKINNYKSLIDYEKSGFRLLQDGSKILSTPRIFKESLEEYYIARDNQTMSEWIISEKFKDLVEKHKLKMKFASV